MHRLIALMTGVQVLLHSIVGCCAHPVHSASDAATACCAVESPASPCSDGCDHPCESLAGTVDASPSAAGDCCGLPAQGSSSHACAHDACAWSTDGVNKLVWKSFAYEFAAYEFPPGDFASLAPRGGATDRPIALSPPLRRHLVLGVLLV